MTLDLLGKSKAIYVIYVPTLRHLFFLNGLKEVISWGCGGSFANSKQPYQRFNGFSKVCWIWIGFMVSFI